MVGGGQLVSVHQTANSQYHHLEGEIPLDLPEEAFISIERHKAFKIHSIGFQPAKSIPEIPRWFLKKYTSKNDLILEPFAGSGTSIIETLYLERNSVWLDNQPLSRKICQLKTTYYEPSLILQKAQEIINHSSQELQAPSKVNFKNKNFWFQKPVQEGLELLRTKIFQCNQDTRIPLEIAFASTVRKCSNMNDGMILAARRKNFTDIPERNRQDVFKYFSIYVRKIAEALEEWNELIDWSHNIASQINTHDARKINYNKQLDGIVTSPPYINAIDYVWASKFELHWLNLVSSDRERLDLYSQEIGTERIPSKEYNQLGKFGYDSLDNAIENIYTGKFYQASKGQNKLRARVVYKYFLDMQKHFISSLENLKSGGYYCFTVGDSSKICGVTIPVASLLTELALQIGFIKEFRFHLLLKNRKLNIPRNVNWANTIKHDAIIVLRKP